MAGVFSCAPTFGHVDMPGPRGTQSVSVEGRPCVELFSARGLKTGGGPKASNPLGVSKAISVFGSLEASDASFPRRFGQGLVF